MTLELSYKPDADMALKRIQAWWSKEILDRPAIQVMAPLGASPPRPARHHASLRERWMDAEYAVACADHHCASVFWGGEIFPTFWPNLGPDILGAAYGCELEFGEDTSWSKPILKDWENPPEMSLEPHNIYTRKILEMTRLGLEVGKGKFITGHTDIHPDADLLAALRDPQALCEDLAIVPEKVGDLTERLCPAFFEYYNLQHALMLEQGQTVTTSWLPLIAEGKYYIPSNDFSCMISPAMFRKYFLPQIVEQADWLDRSIYHLDGPDALRHLDDLLAIRSLDAIQYVWGSGKGRASDWLEVFQKIQRAGKNLWIPIEADELDLFMNSLSPVGAMLCLWVQTVEEARGVLRRIESWKA